MARHWFYDTHGEQVHESAAIDNDDARLFAADKRAHAAEPYNPADMLAILQSMAADLTTRADLRGQDELEHEAAMEQRAEDRAAARRGDFDGETSREWLARKRAG